ncbi:hypothetical protein [Pedobacter sp. GR22-10]|uniref:hypothetical protein n=1 Tax=Pedobacter sp. GR22-10 TaxID=2994472 RepID=UPI002245D663|nr:hypothetical protein [Pedobacter sp. GR22-10]MCX2429931.1 hypothetical protein [Pedobacter sp. GR22-10]
MNVDRIIDIVKAFYESEYINAIHEIRLATVEDLAMFMNISVHELIEILYPFMKRGQEEMIEYFQKDSIEPLYSHLLTAVKDIDDYSAKIFAQELYLKTHIIDTFNEYYEDIIPSENQHLLKLLPHLPYPIERLDTADDYYDFLFQIPSLYSFELDFNAYLRAGKSTLPLPILHFNYLLFAVTENFLETIGYVILESEDNYHTSRLRKIADIHSRAENMEVVAAFLSCFCLIKGESPVLMKIKLEPEASMNLHYAFGASFMPYISMHELGHLFLGHIDTVYYKEMEYEADLFALKYITGLIRKHGQDAKFRLFLGLSGFYALLHCRELIMPMENQNDYPTARDRFMKIVNRFDKLDQEKFGKAWNYVVLATHHILKKVYDIELQLADF